MKTIFFVFGFFSVVFLLPAQTAIRNPKPVVSPSTKLNAGTAETSLRSSYLQQSSNVSLRDNGMSFTPNKGQSVDSKQQLRPDILFKGDGGGADVYIRKTGISYVQSNMREVMHEIDEQVEEKEKEKENPAKKIETEKLKQELTQKASIKINRIDVDFVGSNKSPQTQMDDPIAGYTNYYFGHCPQGITNVHSYNIVTQKNIYNNVDIKYYAGSTNGLKYDIIVNPGADPGQIKLKYSGVKSVRIKDNRLQIESELGQMQGVYDKLTRLS